MKQTLDEIDKRILYYLSLDARRISAPEITQNLDVSAATIRNRIKQLEDRGVIQGYHANIDYEKTGGKLTYLFICNSESPHREIYATQALQIPGVVHVRDVMSGRQNLHIEAVGEDKQEITRIGQDLSNMGLEIENEALVQRDYHHPYQPFGPDSALSPHVSNLMRLQELAGDAKVVDITVSHSAEASGKRIRELSEEGLLDDDLLIVAIERDDTIITPNGETEIRGGDIVTVISQHGDTNDLTDHFSDGRSRSNQNNEVRESS